jgi:hypothetical protein
LRSFANAFLRQQFFVSAIFSFICTFYLQPCYCLFYEIRRNIRDPYVTVFYHLPCGKHVLHSAFAIALLPE